jgi:hypothetical protein
MYYDSQSKHYYVKISLRSKVVVYNDKNTHVALGYSVPPHCGLEYIFMYMKQPVSAITSRRGIRLSDSEWS